MGRVVCHSEKAAVVKTRTEGSPMKAGVVWSNREEAHCGRGLWCSSLGGRAMLSSGPGRPASPGLQGAAPGGATGQVVGVGSGRVEDSPVHQTVVAVREVRPQRARLSGQGEGLPAPCQQRNCF